MRCVGAMVKAEVLSADAIRKRFRELYPGN
jgi:hypothetical protein